MVKLRVLKLRVQNCEKCRCTTFRPLNVELALIELHGNFTRHFTRISLEFHQNFAPLPVPLDGCLWASKRLESSCEPLERPRFSERSRRLGPIRACPGPIPGPKASCPDSPCALFYSVSDPSRCRGGGPSRPVLVLGVPSRIGPGRAETDFLATSEIVNATTFFKRTQICDPGGHGEESNRPNCPKVVRGECERWFGATVRKCRKSLLHWRERGLHRCEQGLHRCERLFLHFRTGAPNDLSHSPLTTLGQFGRFDSSPCPPGSQPQMRVWPQLPFGGSPPSPHCNSRSLPSSHGPSLPPPNPLALFEMLREGAARVGVGGGVVGRRGFPPSGTSLSFRSLVFWSSLANFKQGISLLKMCFSLLFPRF